MELLIAVYYVIVYILIMKVYNCHGVVACVLFQLTGGCGDISKNWDWGAF